MRNTIKEFIRRIAAAGRADPPPYPPYLLNRDAAATQLALIHQYRIMCSGTMLPARIQDTGFGLHSQHEEDGILLYIFSLIGTTNKTAIEACCGNGIECNTTNLIVHHGWNGLLLDGSEHNVNLASQFFKKHPNTTYWPPKIVQSWITAENINQTIKDAEITGTIDLLSIDIDGIDYWLWDAITEVQPRVIVVEINHLWGVRKAVTVPYDPKFIAGRTKYGSDYAGASLPAFLKLADKKGYRFIGTNRFATNAFFVMDSISKDLFPECRPADCFDHPRAQFGMRVRYEGIKDNNWKEV
jgi:hypothetical protein